VARLRRAGLAFPPAVPGGWGATPPPGGHRCV